MEIRSHASTKNSAKANFLKAMRKHQWNMHRNTMISRIKAGKAFSKIARDPIRFIVLLQDNPVLASNYLKNITLAQRRSVRDSTNELKDILPEETWTMWKLIETTLF
jgi:hypothetical protein